MARVTDRWRHLPTRANGQLAVACYLFDEEQGGFAPAVIDVLTLEGDKISSVVGSLTDSGLGQPSASAWFSGPAVFARFGLPSEVDWGFAGNIAVRHCTFLRAILGDTCLQVGA